MGKTTLLRSHLQPEYRYVLLEDPDTRQLAIEDPRTFLARYPAPLVIDEFQYAPELTSYLQGLVDERRSQPGQYVLTGSQNFEMMAKVTQSLAGRAGILSLYGLSTRELGFTDAQLSEEGTIARLILRGSYPELWANPKADAGAWFGSYLRTYLERDVRGLAQVGDLAAFERFVRLCAIRTGQILNISDLARDAGVSPPTAKHWLSLLIQTYQVHLVEPFYENLSSRVRKAPKLYFVDVGLAAYMMGFRFAESLVAAPQWGALFETLVLGEFLRATSASGEVPEHYYLHARASFELDLMVQDEGKWRLIEIKYGRTIAPDRFRQLQKGAKSLGPDRVRTATLLAPIPEPIEHQDARAIPWASAFDRR